jgi:hypothetical protein
MDKTTRRKQGAHYTSEKNILKVIEPLFLDDLKAEFFQLKARKDRRRLKDLKAFTTSSVTSPFSIRPAGAATF